MSVVSLQYYSLGQIDLSNNSSENYSIVKFSLKINYNTTKYKNQIVSSMMHACKKGTDAYGTPCQPSA